MKKTLFQVDFVPTADITLRRIVKQGSANFQVTQASANSDVLIGVMGNLSADQSEGERAGVILSGIAEVDVGGTITRGDLITADANGKAVSVTETMLQSNPVYSIGIALESGVSGDVRGILISPQLIDTHALTTITAGTAGTGVTAVEVTAGHMHRTTLTVAGTLPAIAGGADLAVGLLLYTLPSGAKWIHNAFMSLAITQSEGNITADTPDGGLGTVIASGAVATLDGTATFENIITGQTFNDCNGTAEVIGTNPTAGTGSLYIASGGAHTIYFNVADGWAASGDSGAGLSGTVVIEWSDIT